jgi:ammonium transporter, Amt family
VMGKLVIAESVESESVLEKLREIGVDYAQGFAVGVPRPLEELATVSVADLLA